MLVAIHYHYDERNDGEAKGYRDIASEVEAERKQTQQAIDPDKEKYSQDQRHEAHVPVAQIWLSHLVTHKGDDGLQRILKTTWRFIRTFFTILLANSQHDPQQQCHGQQHAQHI